MFNWFKKANKKEGFKKYYKFAPVLSMSVEDSVKNEITSGKTVDTLEGTQKIKKGDVICKGVDGELWTMSKKRLEDKFDGPGDCLCGKDWKMWTPKKEKTVVLAEKQTEKGKIKTFEYKKGDYILKDVDNEDDVWVTDGKIFNKTYKKYD